MKNKKFARCVSTGTLLALLMLAGCETKEKQDKKLVRGFAEWLAHKADSTAQANFDKNYVYDPRDQVLLLKAKHDSLTYRDALRRDADIVLDYVDTCNDFTAIWNEIQQAQCTPVYGPGSFINEQGEWEYSDNTYLGANKAYKLKINVEEYERSLQEIYRIRNGQRNKNNH